MRPEKSAAHIYGVTSPACHCATATAETTPQLLISVANAAIMLDVSDDHIRRMIEKKMLSTVQIGFERSKLRLRVADIRALVNLLSV